MGLTFNSKGVWYVSTGNFPPGFSNTLRSCLYSRATVCEVVTGTGGPGLEGTGGVG